MRYQLFLGAAAVALIVPAAASAQETTSVIRGTVTNNGVPVAGASVVATDVSSGTRVQTTTNGDGGFTLEYFSIRMRHILRRRSSWRIRSG